MWMYTQHISRQCCTHFYAGEEGDALLLAECYYASSQCRHVIRLLTEKTVHVCDVCYVCIDVDVRCVMSVLLMLICDFGRCDVCVNVYVDVC